MDEVVPRMVEEMHIASLVVHVLPAALNNIERELADHDDMQVHGTHPDGKLVVTLEGATAGEIMNQVSQIRLIAGVLNVSLVYQHTEPR